MSQDRKLNVGFWKRDSGNMITVKSGLTQEDIDALQTLKEGDRLIIWDNSKSKRNKNAPDASLKQFTERPAEEEKKSGGGFKPVKT